MAVTSRYIWTRVAIAVTCLLYNATPRLIQAGVGATLLNGEQLFNDRHLSASGDVSCATCHDPSHAFADPNAVSRGAFAQLGTRNAPSLLNVNQHRDLFWDGRRATLESLLLDPLTHPREHGLSDADGVARVVRRLYGVRELRSITAHDVVTSLATYVRTIATAQSAFDRYSAGDLSALTEAQKHGLQLFAGRAQCSTCHSLDNQAFTDGLYHAGQLSAEAPAHLAQQANRAMNMSSEDRYRLINSDPNFAALGRFIVTLAPQAIGAFATPSLRNVAITGPYMHDGHVDDLQEAVDREIYWRNKRGRLGTLTPADKGDLIAFLKSLSVEPPHKLPASVSTPPERVARRTTRLQCEE